MNPHDSVGWRRHSRKSARRTLKRQRKCRLKKEGTFGKRSGRGSHSWVRKNESNRKFFTAPKVFSIRKNYPESIKFLNAVKDNARRKKYLFLDFKHIEEIGVGALVVLTSIINSKHFLKRSKRPLIKGNFPEDRKINQMFIDAGFYDHVIPDVEIKRSQQSIGGIYKQDGILVMVEIAKVIADMGEELMESVSVGKGLYSVIIEAMGNTREHARPAKPSTETWWILGYVNKRTGVGEFAFYDAGVGIPTSLRGKKLALIHKFMKIGVKDDELLKMALEEGHHSRTKLAYRGRGLPQMVKTIEREQLKDVRIYTNKAFASVAEKAYDLLPEDFPGTLVRWSIEKKEK